MKLNFSSVLIVISMALIHHACSEKKVEKDTPKVLEPDNIDLDASPYPSRLRLRRANLLDQLYKEALGKDEKLNALQNAIEQQRENEDDKLEAYQTFVTANQMYWNIAINSCNQLNDTLLKKELTEVLTTMRIRYGEKISNLTELSLVVQNRKSMLEDQESLMRIFVTLPMITAYQRNEVPNSLPLERTIQELDSLIEATKVYTKLTK